MFTLIACKDNIAHMAISAAVLPHNVCVRWYVLGDALPECTVPNDVIVILEPPSGWEDGVSGLVENNTVWRFNGNMRDVDGVERLGDDLLHGLHYAVHVPLVAPLNFQMKQTVMNRLNRTPQILEDVVLFWLQRVVAKDDDPLTQLTMLWSMDSKTWHSYTRSADLYTTYKCIKSCWGVQPRTITSLTFGTIKAVVAPNNIEEHMHTIAFRGMRDKEAIDFAVVIEPRMHDNGCCVVHWRALDTGTEGVNAWKGYHECDEGDGWSGKLSVMCDHVKWMNGLETTNLSRLLSFMKSKIVPK